MTIKLDQLKSEVDALSDDELATLLDYMSNRFNQREVRNKLNNQNITGFLPRPTAEEIEQELLEIFGPDLMEEIKNMDISQIAPPPPGTPTMTDIVSWGRESSF